MVIYLHHHDLYSGLRKAISQNQTETMATLAHRTCHRFLKFEPILGQLGIIISHIFRHSQLHPSARRTWGTVSQIPDRESFLAGSNGSNFQWDETVSKTGSGGVNQKSHLLKILSHTILRRLQIKQTFIEQITVFKQKNRIAALYLHFIELLL